MTEHLITIDSSLNILPHKTSVKNGDKVTFCNHANFTITVDFLNNKPPFKHYRIPICIEAHHESERFTVGGLLRKVEGTFVFDICPHAHFNVGNDGGGKSGEIVVND